MSPFLLRRASDEKLGGRLAAGEAAAFEELYRRYARRLAAYGARLTGDRSVGDDVAQTALMNAYAAILDGRAPTQLRPWLYRIAHNAALDHIARSREVPSLVLGDRAAPQRDPMGAALVVAVASLPERQRRVFVLRELHGLRIDETATELGLTAAQVEQALFAARNRLSEQLAFGGRLDCIAVRRLGRESLDVRERRALKAHLRSCPRCRADAGLIERAGALAPLAPLLWLRGLVTGLAGSSAAALKVGAVVATIGVAAGVPALRIETREARVAPAEAVLVPHDERFQDVAAVAAPTSPSSRRTPSPIGSVSASIGIVPAPRPDRGPSRGVVRRTAPDDGSAESVDKRGRGGGDTVPPPPASPPVAVAAPPPAQVTVESRSDGSGDSSGPGSSALTVDARGDGSNSGSGHDGSVDTADGSGSSGGDRSLDATN